jgi:acyl-[acyl-carrier-protein] desaturase
VVSVLTDSQLLADLEPVAGDLFERHLATAKEWFPHELVPWERAVADPVVVDDVARRALFVNLLTEDNLPYYFRTIERVFGAGSVWGQWVRRWTAEEGRHSIVIRDYLTVTRSVDPYELERGRMAQVSGGVVPEPETVADGMVYVALQELATRISHRNTGRLLEDRAGYEVMARVAADENLHFLFYRDLCSAALVADPSGMVLAIDRQVRGFSMPGLGIPDFPAHAAAMARAGIYDFGVHHDQILVPVVLRHWGVESLTGLSDEASQARDRVVHHVERVGRAARRLAHSA